MNESIFEMTLLINDGYKGLVMHRWAFYEWKIVESGRRTTSLIWNSLNLSALESSGSVEYWSIDFQSISKSKTNLVKVSYYSHELQVGNLNYGLNSHQGFCYGYNWMIYVEMFNSRKSVDNSRVHDLYWKCPYHSNGPYSHYSPF